MSRFATSGPLVPFTLPGDCQCKGSPHPDGDIVYFRSRLSFEGGVAAKAATRAAAIQAGRDASPEVLEEELEKRLGTIYVIHGIAAWNLLDAEGRDVPVTEAAIRSLDWTEALFPLTDKASELYGDETFAPFQRGLRKSTPPSQTDASTSPTPISSRKPSNRSKRSSRGITAASRRSA